MAATAARIPSQAREEVVDVGQKGPRGGGQPNTPPLGDGIGNACDSTPNGPGGSSDECQVDPSHLQVGSAQSDKLRGTRYADKLEGLGSKDKINGGKGRDKLSGAKGKDKMNGGEGRDSLIGGAQGDRIRPGKGVDRVYAGGGDDVIKARDGRRDFIKCGGGNDRVVTDAKDRVAASCERVRINQTPPLDRTFWRAEIETSTT